MISWLGAYVVPYTRLVERTAKFSWEVLASAAPADEYRVRSGCHSVYCGIDTMEERRRPVTSVDAHAEAGRAYLDHGQVSAE